MTLVTGGTGFIGRHVLERLAKTGEHVRALIRRPADLPPGVEPVRGDLVSGEGIAAAPNSVLANETSVPSSTLMRIGAAVGF